MPFLKRSNRHPGEALVLEQDDLNQIGGARSLLCFWAVRELGISMTAVAPRFSLTDVAIGYAVARGQKIAREKGYVMVEG